MRLTEKTIKALEPPERGNRISYDDEVSGFGVRVTTGGHRAFILNYRTEGRERRLTIGSWPAWSATGARRRAKDLRVLIDQGEDPLAEKQERRAAPTVAHIAAEYLARHASRKKTGNADRLYLERDVLPGWGNLKAKDIRRRDVIRLVETKAHATPIAGNYLLSVIRTLFDWAVERELVEANPCWGVKPPAKKSSRDRVLSEDEIRTVWGKLDDAAMGPESRLAVRFMLATGQRSGEACGLTWDELDAAREWWTIPKERSKNGLAHRVPLTALARELLKQGAKGSRFVFQSSRGPKALTVGGLSNAVKWNLDHFDVVHFTPHDLRRSVASHLASLGVERLVIGKILNHTEKGVTSVYDRHGYDQEKRRALMKWDRRLREIVGGTESAKVVAIDG
ncbi:MAG: tyrosine-type recombinase/integrase [Acidobacteria bacterium]|nr:tyrosine-type recombinase/integrase [Acidobacteriota bacterium]